MQVSKGTWPAGIEYWQPLFFEQTETLFDYLPDESQIIIIGDLEPAIDRFLADVNERYEQRKVDPLRPLLPPGELWLQKITCLPDSNNFHQYNCIKPQLRISQAEPMHLWIYCRISGCSTSKKSLSVLCVGFLKVLKAKLSFG